MLDSNRFQRLLKRIYSRSYDYYQLRKVISKEEAQAWVKTNYLQSFNGNVLRSKIVQGLVAQAKCDYFIETGTSHAATAIAANKFLNIPVLSCEINPRDYFISKIVTFGIKNIHLYNLDSIIFLQEVIEKFDSHKIIPFFYLDAHEGEIDKDSLPLVEEISIILKKVEQFVVLIDDFRVPDNDDFKWGRYGKIDVDLKLIKEILLEAEIENCYFPNYKTEEESNYPSGYSIFWRSPILDTKMKSASFPFDLIRTFSLKQNSYIYRE